MRRMFSKEQLLKIIGDYSKEELKIYLSESGLTINDGTTDLFLSGDDGVLTFNGALTIGAVDGVQVLDSVIIGTEEDTQDLTVHGYIKQTHPKYLYEFEIMVEDTTNFEKDGEQYCRIEEVNGEIHIIIMAQFKNTDTANSHSTRLGQVNIVNIPTDLSSKIYGVNGPVTQDGAGNIRIACMGAEGTNTVIQPIRLRSNSANSIILYQPNNITVSANGTLFVSLEVNLSVV